MRKRMMKVMGILVCGYSFQLASCQNQQVAEIVAEGFKDTFIAVTTFAAEAVMDNALRN